MADTGDLILEAVLAWLAKHNDNPDPAALTLDPAARSQLATQLVLLRAGAAGGVEAQERLERIYTAYRAHGERGVVAEVKAQLGVQPTGSGRKKTGGANPVAVTVAYLSELWDPERKPSDVTREMKLAAIEKIAKRGAWMAGPGGSTSEDGCRKFLHDHCRNAMKKDRGGELEKTVLATFAQLTHRSGRGDPERPKVVATAGAWVDWFVETSLPSL